MEGARIGVGEGELRRMVRKSDLPAENGMKNSSISKLTGVPAAFTVPAQTLIGVNIFCPWAEAQRGIGRK